MVPLVEQLADEPAQEAAADDASRDSRAAGARGATTQAAHQALETAPSGTVVPWRNPDNGHTGTVTPVRTYQASSGGSCREYETTGTARGRLGGGRGTGWRH